MSDNRRKIMVEALCLFASRGYDAVSVQDIVDAAEVTKPTLYHYFNNKIGLFEAILEENAEILLGRLRKATIYSGDATFTISQIVRTYFTYAEEFPNFYRLMLATWFAPPSTDYYRLVADLQVRQFHLIEYMFQEAANQHGNMRGRHKQYAVGLKGMIDTYVGLSLQEYLHLGDDALIHGLVHQFMHGIFS